MATVNVPREQLAKILTDVEALIADVEALDQGSIARQRLEAMRQDPSRRRSEEELDAYLDGAKIGSWNSAYRKQLEGSG